MNENEIMKQKIKNWDDLEPEQQNFLLEQRYKIQQAWKYVSDKTIQELEEKDEEYKTKPKDEKK